MKIKCAARRCSSYTWGCIEIWHATANLSLAEPRIGGLAHFRPQIVEISLDKCLMINTKNNTIVSLVND